MSLYPSIIPESPSSTLIEPVRSLSLNDPSLNDNDQESSNYYDNNNFNLYRQESYLLTDFFSDSHDESFEDDRGYSGGGNLNNDSDEVINDITMEESKEEIETPSLTSTCDPESDYPEMEEYLQQSEEFAWEYLRHFVGHEFQDEAGLDYGEKPEDKIWDDDEGMDPLENQ
ncbi:3228_t:CDS:1 [Scutellospora calospora]|uniref:3228_t:CDS:1 n=1 Tax=Scutellospora calospora TaxID=85575 RepID=A0ACA9JTU7_9GLOM|nr:3228_t:CDS:1 [Scutellospora calospora]